MAMNQEGKPYIDLDTGLGRVRNNKKIYSRMLGLFLQSPEFDAFEAAMAEGDNAKAAEVAHAIKGMTGNLALDAIFTDSEALMTQLRNGDADPALLERYRSDLAETRNEVDALLPQLQE